MRLIRKKNQTKEQAVSMGLSCRVLSSVFLAIDANLFSVTENADCFQQENVLYFIP